MRPISMAASIRLIPTANLSVPQSAGWGCRVTEYVFQIDGRILAWMRPAQNGRRRYDPPEQVAYKRLVAVLALQARRKAGMQMIEGPVSLGVTVFYPQIKSDPTRLWKVSVPDYDNIVKNIKDALKGIAWIDDAQVAHYKEGGKIYLSADSPLCEHAIVRISDAAEYDYRFLTDTRGF